MKWNIILILLVCIPIVYSIEAGSKETIVTLPICYGDYTIRVKGEVTSEQIGFERCTLLEDKVWKCKCSRNKDTEVVLTTQPKIKTKPFDVAVSYFIREDMDRDNQRTKNFNNIQVGVTSKPEVPFEWPKISSGGSIGVISLIIIIALCLIVFVIIVLRILFGEIFTDLKKEEDISDKEALDFINKI